MDAELSERVMVCLRGLDIGESISADGIADEIGEKLSDVYDSIERLEAAKLVQLYPAFRKGSDPTYTLTAKGRHQMQPEVMQTPPEMPEKKAAAPAVRPSADRVCRFCGKELEPNKVRRHENMCGKNPDHVAAHRKHPEPEPVPAPIEYAEESNATVTIEHEVDAEELPEVLEQFNAEDPDVPDEVPPLEEVAHVAKCDMLVLKGSPGMNAVMRLLAQCQQMVEDGADMSLNASVKVSAGFFVNIELNIPADEDQEAEPRD